ncbi:TonB-dependent receptor [Pseudoalteromonas sp. MSK9-3]|uniref:TonB-dependent receptor plug domain-containing protein n=1 Tax=Pseudoalteromonas sp. MSK9-3 TaxID=1897633 RepID=UPI000E6C1B02|nr:TonB-dependent receptor [Pseudoalteromonas sp. MSK9-3]RJE76455.1 TonB-dependent receptor [Pseudoalteromonas sp. MSK9-3]
MAFNTNRCILAIAVSLACSGQSLATIPQTIDVNNTSTQPNASDEEKTEKIVVTGSRIKRDSFSVATPIATMDSDALVDSGFGSLAEVLAESLPQFGEGNNNANSQSSVQNSGLSTIDLRELGNNRTLTLIDGRRVVSNSYSGNYVSLSTIPKGMVERVEIITGGASAAYGSDAIAGVVNIITQQDQEGFTISSRVGESTEGGGKETTVNFDYGTTFNDDRGYAFFSTTYNKQDILGYWDRDRAQQQDAWAYDDKRMCNTMQTATYDPLTKTNRHCIRDINPSQWTNLSDSIPGGVFDEKSSTKPNAGYWYDGTTLRNDWNEELHGIHFNQFRPLKLPDSQISSAFKAEYEFNSGIESYFQVQYSQTKSKNQRSPESEDECDAIVTYNPSEDTFGSNCIGRIPYDNPYMPQEIRDQASSKGVKWDRLFSEVGDITTRNDRSTIRTWAGLRGYVWSDWEWDVSVSYGRFKQEQTRSNELFVANVTHALNAEELADGTVQCKDEAARANGCVPINLFGAGSISSQAADYIRANPSISTQVKQTIATGFITGDIYELPAGPVSTAFGFEYRKDQQSVSTNVPEGGITFNFVPNFSGDVSVYEGFAEASIPLLKDAPMAKSLTAEVSARFADYSWSTTGLIQSYKAGFVYEPSNGYLVRANWARAMRAPTITELMSPPRGDYDSFSDLCDGTTATSTGPGHDNCRREAGIINTITQDGEFSDDNNQYSPNAGNADLFEETADTYTLGISLTPDYIPGFRVALDFYDIRVKDAITALSNDDIIGFCYNSTMAYGSGNEFCNDLRRDEDGQLVEVKQRLINTDEIRTKGYDIALEYSYDLPEYGNLKLKLDWSHVIEYSITSTGPDGAFDTFYEGYLTDNIFEDKGSASLTWRYDDLRIRWSTRYKGEIRRSLNTTKAWEQDMANNATNCAQGADTCISDPEPLWGNDLPSHITHNISLSYLIDINAQSELQVYGGVNNLTDEHGPFVIGGTGNFDSMYGGGLGRFAFIGAKYTF